MEFDHDPLVVELKSKCWNKWLNEPIPMIGNVTPMHAAKTSKGREKLNELFAFYDSDRPISGVDGSFDPNIPTQYAKWKLGYGKGSASEFAEEEAILNYKNPRRATKRIERHTRELEKKKTTIWIPARCEVKGCTKRGDEVKACSKCHCAYYCGREHQSQDWERHKLDCKALRKCDFLHARPFLPSRELEKYPLGCFPVTRSRSSVENPKCFLCHANSSEVDITYTECCNLPICNNSHEYEPFSYSRDFCQRSHDSYTACATHMHEGHNGDWRDCAECNKEQDGGRSFRATNGFCATPCLEKFIAQGSMITFGCDGQGCKNRMIPGHSGFCSKNGSVYCSNLCS